mgnify:CR=1 FL=1
MISPVFPTAAHQQDVLDFYNIYVRKFLPVL